MLKANLYLNVERNYIFEAEFPHNGATCHIANVIINLLRSVFQNRIFSKNDVNRLEAGISLCWTIFCGMPLRIITVPNIPRGFRALKTKLVDKIYAKSIIATATRYLFKNERSAKSYILSDAREELNQNYVLDSREKEYSFQNYSLKCRLS